MDNAIVLRVFTADPEVHSKLSSLTQLQRDLTAYHLLKHLDQSADLGFIEPNSYWQPNHRYCSKMSRNFVAVTPKSGAGGGNGGSSTGAP